MATARGSILLSRRAARKWVYRFSFARKITEMGPGSADVVSLADARSYLFASAQNDN
jgi:hypothetical protein